MTFWHGKDKVIIRIDFGDDDCFVLRVLCIYVCLNVLCAVDAVSINLGVAFQPLSVL